MLQLADLIADYNRNKHFSSSQCNAIHFVEDVLKCLGISETKFPVLERVLTPFLTTVPGKIKN